MNEQQPYRFTWELALAALGFFAGIIALLLCGCMPG